MFCSRVVEKFGDWWGYIGWLLFVLYMLIPFASTNDPSAMLAWMVCIPLLLAWWIFDFVDQQTPWWMVLLGVVMILSQVLFLEIACWVLYWMKVRE